MSESESGVDVLVVRSSDISTACLSCSSDSLLSQTLTLLQLAALTMPLLPCAAAGVTVKGLSTADDTGRGLVLDDTSRAGRFPAIDGILQTHTTIVVYLGMNKLAVE